MISRRLILTGILAAPLIVRSGILMPVKPVEVWSNNELIAGVFTITRELFCYHPQKPPAEIDAMFRVAALRERANPQFIEYASLHFASAGA